MFKKLLKAGTTFTLLLGCYFGYVRAFGYLVHQLKSERPDDDISIPIHSSKSKKYAQDLARLAFGPNHWTVTNDQPYAYYNAERGFWMFALEVKEIQEEDGVRYDGKRLKMQPFAVIWKSSDGKNIQRLTAESATLDLNQSIALSSKQNTEGLKVKHAHIERDVRIRDDRGTPTILSDDMNVGPLTYLDFDDATQQITSESHVIIVDPDQTTTGDGLEIQLRKPDPNDLPTSSPSGFGGVQYAILQKNPRVHMRDVGNSDVLGSAPAGKTATPARSIDLAANPSARKAATQDAKPKAADEPVPLYIQADDKMRVDWPPDRSPVLVGPPAPPAPTLVRFERNVVALHGRPDRQPNQLDCDTLRLNLIPGPPPARPKTDKADDKDTANKAEAVKDKTTATPDALASSGPSEAAMATAAGAAASRAAGPADGDAPPSGGKSGNSLFGNLTLQKLHATGHAVWLQLREQGSKVRCAELIHDRRMPYRPDSTLFRGDKTRPIYLEKIDYEPEETNEDGAAGADGRLARSAQPRNPARKVSSVTHVVTVSATLFDRGHGMDLADVRAFGPGRLETRPDLREPVERVAVWQDELIIVNDVGPDEKLQQKRVTLTGTRPFFMDLVKETTIDSGQEIRVFLKPKTPPPAAAAPASSGASPVGAERALATAEAARPPGVAADAFADKGGPPATAGTPATGAAADSGIGGSLQIERLLAFRDVHLKAPNRRMEAREWLDAPFIEVDPPPAEASETEAGADGSTAADTDAEGPPKAEDEAVATAPGEVAAKDAAPQAAKDAAPQTPAEPAMTGVADRIWATVAMPRGKGLEAGKSQRRKPKAKAADPGPAMAAADAAPGSDDAKAAEAEAPKEKETEADIREAWLRGNVALHQDVPPDPNKKDQAKPQGNDVFGEAVYLDNRGKGKVNAKVYYRDPTETVLRPGPIPWAKVATDDMTIRGEIIWMDQEHDKVWVYGPGKLTQWTDRALLTDKAPESKPATEGSGAGAPPAPASAGRTVTSVANAGTARGAGLRAGSPAGTGGSGPAGTGPVRGAGSRRGQADRVATTDGAPGVQRPADPQAPPKPRTRAGRPIGEKDLLTVTWTRRMQFDGRTTDTLGRPAGRADFIGVVNAEMTDMLLHCERNMIVFTDREVPLADIGASKPGSKAGAREVQQAEPQEGDEAADDAPPRSSQADLSLIYCFGNPVAISRKVDPDAPVVLEKQRVDAFDREDPNRRDAKAFIPGRLDYNRLTGEFFVPGPGIVYLYDRPDESKKDESKKDGADEATGRELEPARGGQRQANGRTVTPTSARSPVGAAGTSAPSGRGATRNAAVGPATPPVTRKLPPLVLMQVEFSTAMRGRMGSGQASDTRQTRWSEFFGNVEFLRSKVLHDGVILDPDQDLPEDGFYLTSQMLRIIQDPPPSGSPEKTPSRTFAKAWDRVHVNKGEAFGIEADVATYDSANDVLWAYGEGSRGVMLIQQLGPGQQASQSPAKAVQYNVKTRGWTSVESNALRIVDKRTGTRPVNLPVPDPTAPPKKKRKTPFRVPNTNLERRGFTGY